MPDMHLRPLQARSEEGAADRPHAESWYTAEDVRNGMILAAALGVLPLLPDRPIDSLGLFNPFALWRLIVVLMGINLLSSLAMRIMGVRAGLLASGFAGGFVSSTAVVVAMGARAKNDKRLTRACAAASVTAAFGSLIFLAALVTAADPGILSPLTVPFACGGVLVLAYDLSLARNDCNAPISKGGPAQPFDLRSGVLFIALVLGFSLLSWALIAWFGPMLIFAGVIGTALIDAHAAAVSIANLVASSRLDARAGSLAILVGFSANMLAKAPTAYALGGSPYGIRVTGGLVMLVIGLWVGFAWGS